MPRTKTGKGAGGAGSIRKITTTRNGKTYTYWQGRYTEGFDPGTGKQIQRSITGKTQVELYIAPRLGNIKLEALNTHTVQHFYNQLVSPTDPTVNPLSAKTVKNIHGVFHKALQQAVLIGYLRVNPTDACTLPRVIKKEMHPLEEDQVTAFLKEVQGDPTNTFTKSRCLQGYGRVKYLG